MSRVRLSNEVRRKFVDYFTRKHGHTFVKSSSVVPEGDDSLSFVNAGMNQFKNIFLADLELYNPSRVCNYQKCIRVGGKTCDLASIGQDLRHQTFFEMLGNWSFNDYGKQQACDWALDFLVNHLELKFDKISVTYFSGKDEEDKEVRDIWSALGIPSERIIANKEGDNFWDMGKTGPCGLSTEIFYPTRDGPLEIWNLVFIDRQKISENSNETVRLKRKFVDTGMGLERILSVLEGTESNFDTDLFSGMFAAIQKKSDVEPYDGESMNPLHVNYRIFVDHCRMITIALADGVEPGRRGREFNLRSMIKRTIDISRDVFHQEQPRYLIFDLVDETIASLRDAYPELGDSNVVKKIRRTLAKESRRYLDWLNRSAEKRRE